MPSIGSERSSYGGSRRSKSNTVGGTGCEVLGANRRRQLVQVVPVEALRRPSAIQCCTRVVSAKIDTPHGFRSAPVRCSQPLVGKWVVDTRRDERPLSVAVIGFGCRRPRGRR
jgi:hypothetical protein